MGEAVQGLLYGIGVLAAIVVLFIICREIICWYWKINQNIQLLTEIRDELRHLRGTAPTQKLEDKVQDKEGAVLPKQDEGGRYIIPDS